MADAPIDVWNEIRVTSEGISITLLSEKASRPAIVEDEMWFTFDELQEMAPSEPLSLNLSDGTRESLSDQREEANIGRILQSEDLSEKAENVPENPTTKELLAYMGFVDDRPESEIRTGYRLPDVGDVLRDTGDLPSWSEDDRVRVINVTETPAEEYELETDDWGKQTVADYNPSEPEDAPVVVANYIGSEKEYAFPVTRLEEIDTGGSGVGYAVDEDGNVPGVDL